MRKGLGVAGILAVLCLGLVLRSLAAAAPVPLHVLSFSAIPNAGGLHPIASAAGPTAGDVLIAGFDFTSQNVVEAVDKSTGKLDAGVGANGVLPLPAGYPSSHGQVGDIEFLGHTIYGAFYGSSTSAIYLVSWNALGRLNSSFGRGGLVTIPGPPPGGFAPGVHLVLSAGRLIVGGVAGVKLALTPVDPATGAVGATTVEPAPPGGAPYITAFMAMQVGPDGKLYALGAAGVSSSSDGMYYGIFDGSTLGAIGQTIVADGSNVCAACGEALSFLGSTVYLGDTSGTYSKGTAHLWSAPVGSTAAPSGPLRVPVPLSGANQGLVALTPGHPGALYITVADQTKNTAASYVMETDGSTFGPSVLVAPNTVATTAVSDPGNDEVTGFTATESNGFTSYTGGFVSIVGESGPCTPKLRILKTIEPYSNPQDVRLVPHTSPPDFYVSYIRGAGTSGPKFAFIIYVTNESACEARNVVVDDEPGVFVAHLSGSELLGPPAMVVPPPSGPVRVRVRIPSLPPGATFEYRILATIRTSEPAFRTDNTASIAGGPTSTVFMHAQPEPVVTNVDPGPNEIQGTAEPVRGLRLIWVALQWAFSGASDARSHCRWLSSTKPTFKTLPCTRVIWVRAQGTTHWRLVFPHRLPRGRYLVFALALGKYGLSADPLTPRAGDVNAFRVR